MRFDETIEAMGWDKIRSRITLVTRDGRTIERWADERHRGGPDHPLTDRELEGKFADCAAGLLPERDRESLFGDVWRVETLPDVSVLLDRLAWTEYRT